MKISTIIILFFTNICFAKTVDFTVDSPAIEPFGTCKLNAQLVLPEKPLALAIIIHGSGGLDKDGTVQVYKPYKDIAEQLYNKNIATVRYDKRNSKPNCANKINHPDFSYKVFISDAKNVIEKAIGIENNKNLPLFIISHSQGVNFSSIISIEDKRIVGQVLIAGLGHYAIDETVIRQLQNLLKKPNLPKEQIAAISKMLKEGSLFFKKIRSGKYKKKDFFMGAFAGFWSSYINMTENASITARQVNIPSLIIQGTLDENITKEDFNSLVEATKDVNGSDSIMFEGIHHLMIAPKEKKVSQNVTNKIATWIKHKVL